MKNQSRTMNSSTIRSTVSLSLLFLFAVVQAPAEAANENSARRAQVVSHWTAERRAAAIPRDLVIDSRGLGYLRRADGSLVPHGHQISAASDARPVPQAKPGGGPGGGGNNDSTPPEISVLNPAEGETIGASHTFSANVIDINSGVKSVTFFINIPGGTVESFSASNSSGDTWSVTLQGFTDATEWSWYVEAKDNAKRGGNTAVSGTVNFTVSAGGGTGNGDTITNAPYTGGGNVQRAAGRLFFEMPNNARRKGPWTGYVCSGTVVFDSATDRSVILTASHCVYDDANGAFARNVMFIPDQAGGGSGTDRNCGNDPIGCWVTSFGVVDVNWTTRVFPDNIPWDYGFYVVDDEGAHDGAAASSDALDLAVTAMSISFDPPWVDDGTAGAGTPDFSFGMGYSYSDDPNFMYCAEDMTTEGADNWWLPSCGLSGGSSGGPWLQPPNSGNGTVISVNSWGYTTNPGMAGPKLSDTSASCVFSEAASVLFEVVPTIDGDAGYIVDPDSCP